MLSPSSFLQVTLITAFFCAPTGYSIASRESTGARGRPTITLTGDITQDMTWRKSYAYAIDGEVHVKAGVTLTIEDEVLVLLRNGQKPGRLLNRSALIFDSGSRLSADTVFIRAVDDRNHVVRRADNGGVWFLGTYRQAEKDGVSVVLNPGTLKSHFSAKRIVATYLGCGDPPEAPDSGDGDEDLDLTAITREQENNDGDDADDPTSDDLDGVSILGVGKYEWAIKEVQSEFSGDDGFDVTNSRLRLQSLTVRSPAEDGLNISSSRLEIDQELKVSMTRSRAPDREIFDLEVDDGPSYVVMRWNCYLSLQGFFGDEIKLKSKDLPLPDPLGVRYYKFYGKLESEASFVYSVDQD